MPKTPQRRATKPKTTIPVPTAAPPATIPAAATPAAPAPRTTLYYRDGRSDKVYHVAIEPQGDRFAVTFAYGRRGSTLHSGTKTPRPVDFAAAQKIYDQLIREKTTKGYSPGEEGTPYQQTPREDRVTGVQPQLLNAIDEEQAQRLIGDDRWWMQQKFDGRRTLIRRQGEQVIGINRSGLVIALPQPIVEAVQQIDSDPCLLDGEAVGEVYHAFDLLEWNGLDLRSFGYVVRWTRLLDLVDPLCTDHLVYADTARCTCQKQKLLDQLRAQKQEGVVFKDRDAPFTPGRPASGGTQLKLKFYATASCIVAGSNAGRRSVMLEMLQGDSRVNVGSVTIPADAPVPERGEIVEVRYLYAFPGGSLYQPVFLGRRDDLALADCGAAQLKLKGEQGDEEP